VSSSGGGRRTIEEVTRVYDGKGEIVDNSEKTCCEDVESGGS
jgi:hypothetical protein